MTGGYTMPHLKSAHILHETPYLSKEPIILAEGTLANATVLGKKANGTYVQLDLTENAEAADAEGVLFGDEDASVAPVNALAHLRLTAMMESYLVWPIGITAEQKAKALNELKAKHIIAQ